MSKLWVLFVVVKPERSNLPLQGQQIIIGDRRVAVKSAITGKPSSLPLYQRRLMLPFAGAKQHHCVFKLCFYLYLQVFSCGNTCSKQPPARLDVCLCSCLLWSLKKQQEFAKIYELCEYILDRSQRPSLLNGTLQTLQRFLTWIPLGYIFERQLIEWVPPPPQYTVLQAS